MGFIWSHTFFLLPRFIMCSWVSQWTHCPGRSQTIENQSPSKWRRAVHHPVQLDINRSYLEDGELPSDDKWVKEILLGQTAHNVLDGVLYQITDDKSLQIIHPAEDSHKLFLEAHERVSLFSGHLHFTVNWASTTGGLECARIWQVVPSLHQVCHTKCGQASQTRTHPHTFGWSIWHSGSGRVPVAKDQERK